MLFQHILQPDIMRSFHFIRYFLFSFSFLIFIHVIAPASGSSSNCAVSSAIAVVIGLVVARRLTAVTSFTQLGKLSAQQLINRKYQFN